MVLEIVGGSHNTEVLGVAEFISSTKAAKILGVSSRAITEWCKDGTIEGAEKLDEDIYNSPWLIPEDSFLKYKREREERLKKKGK
jgi:hypothetical protein